MTFVGRAGIWCRLIITFAIDGLFIGAWGEAVYLIQVVWLRTIERNLPAPYGFILHWTAIAFEVVTFVGLLLFLYRDLEELWHEFRRGRRNGNGQSDDSKDD